MRVRAGFTLIELLVVVVIIGILASVGVKGFASAQDRARNSSMLSNVRTVALGVENWKTDNAGLPTQMLGTDPKVSLASSARTDIDESFKRYVPGGMLPKTPWAKATQVAIDDGEWLNPAQDAGESAGPEGGTYYQPIASGNGGYSPIATGPQKGALPGGANVEDGTIPGANGPTKRTDYGFMFYLGSGNTGRYAIFGVCKIEGKPLISALRTNF